MPQEPDAVAVAFFGRFVRPGELCFDVGANVGDKAEVMLAAGARVLCVEPQSACAEALRSRFALEPGVVVVQAAVAAEAGELELKVCSAAPTISTLADHWTTGRFSPYSWDAVESVGVTTLDALVREHGLPSYCKIDVEGYEREAIAGLSAAPAFLSFEFTEEFIDQAAACMERLEEIGMGRFDFALEENLALELEAWVPRAEMLERLSERFDGGCWGDVYCVRD